MRHLQWYCGADCVVRAQILPAREVFDLVDAEFVIERGRKVKAAMTP